MHLSCTVFELYCVFRRKWRILTHPTLICSPRRGWSRSNFIGNFGVRKLESRGYRVALFAWSYILIQYRSVTDTHTHTERQTDGHTTKAYTALSIASRGKNVLYNIENIYRLFCLVSQYVFAHVISLLLFHSEYSKSHCLQSSLCYKLFFTHFLPFNLQSYWKACSISLTCPKHVHLS